MKNNLNRFTTSICALGFMVLLGACATSESTQRPAEVTATTTGTKFCHKERLYTANNQFVCNWAATAADACRDVTPSSGIAETAVASAPQNARRCESGQWLVQVTMK
ncbi:MAG: hypothetical protein HC782_02065 [Gammaproteobacteria bacterium]|nr:hypothetical protein [Gammaproteobacteria bacterium]